MRPRIYVAGPLSGSGNRLQNVQNAIAVGRTLIEAGFSPLVPHLMHYMDQDDSLGHDTWLDVDFSWVHVAHALYRLPGTSKGADMEVELAESLGIPMVQSLDELQTIAPALGQTALLPAKGEPRFRALLNELWQLHCLKAADYGTGADCFANVRASAAFGAPAWLGVAIRMHDKMTRIQSFAKKGVLANESLEDSFKDLAAYALIALILYREEAS